MQLSKCIRRDHWGGGKRREVRESGSDGRMMKYYYLYLLGQSKDDVADSSDTILDNYILRVVHCQAFNFKVILLSLT